MSIATELIEKYKVEEAAVDRDVVDDKTNLFVKNYVKQTQKDFTQGLGKILKGLKVKFSASELNDFLNYLM